MPKLNIADHRMAILLIALCLSVVCPTPGRANDVHVQAQVDSNRVSVGSALQLSLIITGAQNVPEVPPPQIDGFNIRYLGPTTRVSIINGQYSSSKSFVYSLLALRAGKFTIPSFQIDIQGQTYRTDPIDIQVTQAEAGPTQGASAPATMEDKIFLALKVPKTDVYLYEQLPVKVFLFVSDLRVADIHFPQLKTLGIDIDNFPQPRQYQQVIKGVAYQIVEFDSYLYPTRTGSLTLGPATLDCNLVVTSAGQRSPRGGGSIFNDDFFNSFFDRYEKRPLTVKSKEVTLNVLPLPSEGQPKDFSGAVGQFNFDAHVGPAEVNEGDPVTVKMSVSGSGSLKNIELPAFTQLPQFKVYDPQVKEEDGTKNLEQVVMPQSAAVTQVPAVTFSYFDPSLKKYQVMTKGPFALTVHKIQGGEGLKVVGAPQGPETIAAPEEIGKDIVFIKETPGTFSPVGESLFASSIFDIPVIFVLALWLGLYFLYRRTHRMETDVVYARRLLAPGQARKGLKQAKSLQVSGRQEEFYDALFKTLRQYLGNKLHLSAGAVTVEVLESKLAGRIEEKLMAELKASFEECEAIRYAPASVNAESMNNSYQRVARIIDGMERHLK